MIFNNHVVPSFQSERDFDLGYFLRAEWRWTDSCYVRGWYLRQVYIRSQLLCRLCVLVCVREDNRLNYVHDITIMAFHYEDRKGTLT